MELYGSGTISTTGDLSKALSSALLGMNKRWQILSWDTAYRSDGVTSFLFTAPKGVIRKYKDTKSHDNL